ncbi:NEQ281 [Nanoarchaeum equitans Kin4-M]|uniref:NEQ281 n=1 Tax=Nanoarchaeum equitans (strain Kin4-M) TaxID=228908 RepID=Q74MT9_NANEQ|nr:NEQ281 [Nanoarchaeum equitans Kin4-M]
MNKSDIVILAFFFVSLGLGILTLLPANTVKETTKNQTELKVSKLKLLNVTIAKNNYFSINGVAVNELERKGEVTPILFKVYNSSKGTVYIDTDSYKEISFQKSIAIAKEFVKYFVRTNLDNKDILIKLKVDSPFVAGESAGLPLTLGLIFAAKGYVPQNLDKYVFTGVIMPFGIIGEVGGIDLKYLAATQKGKTLVHGQSTFLGGLYYTDVLSLYRDLFGIELIEKKPIKIPRWYLDITKQLADDLCKKAIEHGFKDSKEYKVYEKAYKNKDYYAAASLCFKYLYDNVPIDTDVYSLILETRKELNDAIKKAKTLYDAEAIGAARERLRIVIELYNKYLDTGNKEFLYKAYWRLQTVKGWLKFVGNTTGIKNYCPKEVVNEINKIYSAFIGETVEIPNSIDCYYLAKEYISNLHYRLFSYPSNVFALIKIAPYYFDRFDLVGYSYYQLSKYLNEDKLLYIIKAIDFSHNYLTNNS